MGVTLDSIRNLNTMGSVTLQGADDAKTLQGATRSQKAGAFFHTNASKARNAEVVATLKSLVASEPRYMGIREHAKGLIEGIKIDKPIKGRQLRDIVSYLDTMSTDKEIKKFIMSEAVKYSKQAHIAHGEDQKDSGVFGLPRRLEGFSTSLTNAYNERLGKTFEESVGVIKNAGLAGGAEARYDAITDIRSRLDAKLNHLSSQLHSLGVPNIVEHNVLIQAIKANWSGEDCETMTQRVDTILRDPYLVADHRMATVELGLGDENGIPDNASFEKILLLQRAKSSYSSVIDNSNVDRELNTSLHNAGITDTTNIKANIFTALRDSVQKDASAGTPVLLDLCVAKTRSFLQSVGDSVTEMKTAVPNPAGQTLAFSQLEKMSELPKAGLFAAMANAAQNMDKASLSTLAKAQTYQELDAAMKGVISAAREAMNAVPQELRPERESSKHDLVRFAVNQSIASMSADAQQALFAKLDSPEALNLVAFYGESAREAGAEQLYAASTTLLAAKAELSNMPEKEIPAVQKELLPPSISTQFSNAELSIGDVKLFTLSSDLRPERFAEVRNRAYDGSMQETFHAEMHKLNAGPNGLSSFEKDIKRTMDVRLPDGSKLPQNFAQAKDALARFVMSNADATYDTLQPADRIKANVIMAHVSQETEKTLMDVSVKTLAQFGSEIFLLSDPHVPDTRVFNLAQSPEGDLTIKYTGKLHASMLIHSDGTFDTVRQDSHTRYDSTTTISHTELERLANADWDAFGARPYHKLSPEQQLDPRAHLDANFCCNAEYRSGVQYCAYSTEDA